MGEQQHKSGIAIMEEKAMATIHANRQQSGVLRYVEMHLDNITEIERLNDLAQISIWGSQGRNIVDKNGSLMANKELPIRGALEVMREEPMTFNGRPQAERDQAAQAREDKAQTYERTILDLVDKGYPLSHAKALVDYRNAFTPSIGIPRRQDLPAKEDMPRDHLIDSEVPDNVTYVNFRKGEKPADIDDQTYGLLGDFMTLSRENMVSRYGENWPAIGSLVVIDVPYEMMDPKSGTEPLEEVSLLSRQ